MSRTFKHPSLIRDYERLKKQVQRARKKLRAGKMSRTQFDALKEQRDRAAAAAGVAVSRTDEVLSTVTARKQRASKGQPVPQDTPPADGGTLQEAPSDVPAEPPRDVPITWGEVVPKIRERLDERDKPSRSLTADLSRELVEEDPETARLIALACAVDQAKGRRTRWLPRWFSAAVAALAVGTLSLIGSGHR